VGVHKEGGMKVNGEYSGCVFIHIVKIEE
jgi:hypothetical protein